ncbi:MAG: GIY-YIG nuclease family protein [Elusimicrobia bacterium]|nr:GIY-YIG nuclease family protein [Elusimicrobiota bacterium]
MSRRGWSVYIVRCSDGSYYTGVAKDLERRLAAHNAGRGAAYTRSRRPVVLLWRADGYGRGRALSREARIKALTRAEKEALVRPRRS